MNYRQKCKLHGAWAFIKFKHDSGLYAACQNCGFIQSGVYDWVKCDANDWNKIMKVHPKKCYRYCPQCGLKMHLYNGDTIYKVDEEG